jgi:hypothetical protein
MDHGSESEGGLILFRFALFFHMVYLIERFVAGEYYYTHVA